MSKRKTGSGGGKDQSSEIAVQMRQMADHLRMHADLLDRLAEKQAVLGNPYVKILPGNFYFHLAGVRSFMQSQIVGKLMSRMKPLAAAEAITMGDMLKQIGELEQMMPEKPSKTADE